MIALRVLHIAKLLVYGDRQKKKTTLAPYKISKITLIANSNKVTSKGNNKSLL